MQMEIIKYLYISSEVYYFFRPGPLGGFRTWKIRLQFAKKCLLKSRGLWVKSRLRWRFNLYKANEVRRVLWKQGHAGSLMQRTTFTDRPTPALVSTPPLDPNYPPEERTGTRLCETSDFKCFCICEKWQNYIYLFIYSFIQPSFIRPSIHTYLLTCMNDITSFSLSFIHLFSHASIHPSINLFTYSSVHLLIQWFIFSPH